MFLFISLLRKIIHQNISFSISTKIYYIAFFINRNFEASSVTRDIVALFYAYSRLLFWYVQVFFSFIYFPKYIVYFNIIVVFLNIMLLWVFKKLSYMRISGKSLNLLYLPVIGHLQLFLFLEYLLFCFAY